MYLNKLKSYFWDNLCLQYLKVSILDRLFWPVLLLSGAFQSYYLVNTRPCVEYKTNLGRSHLLMFLRPWRMVPSSERPTLPQLNVLISILLQALATKEMRTEYNLELIFTVIYLFSISNHHRPISYHFNRYLIYKLSSRCIHQHWAKLHLFKQF